MGIQYAKKLKDLLFPGDDSDPFAISGIASLENQEQKTASKGVDGSLLISSSVKSVMKLSALWMRASAHADRCLCQRRLHLRQ